jgi:hypothetical protein
MSEGYVERPSRWRWALTANLWCGFVEVASGLVTILTLGYYTPPAHEHKWQFFGARTGDDRSSRSRPSQRR